MQCGKIESPKKQSPKIEGTEIQMLEKIMSEKGVWRKIECKEKAVQWNLSARKMSVWKISASMGQKKECKQFQHLHTMGCLWYIANGQRLKVTSQKMEVTVSACFSGKWIPDIRFWTLFCLWYGKHFWPSPINYYILWTTLCMHTCLFSNPWKTSYCHVQGIPNCTLSGLFCFSSRGPPGWPPTMFGVRTDPAWSKEHDQMKSQNCWFYYAQWQKPGIWSGID